MRICFFVTPGISSTSSKSFMCFSKSIRFVVFPVNFLLGLISFSCARAFCLRDASSCCCCIFIIKFIIVFEAPETSLPASLEAIDGALEDRVDEPLGLLGAGVDTTAAVWPPLVPGALALAPWLSLFFLSFSSFFTGSFFTFGFTSFIARKGHEGAIVGGFFSFFPPSTMSVRFFLAFLRGLGNVLSAPMVCTLVFPPFLSSTSRRF